MSIIRMKVVTDSPKKKGGKKVLRMCRSIKDMGDSLPVSGWKERHRAAKV
jgi:hypothetical protein